MENRLQFQDYQWLHLAISTVACILGVVSHLLILIFTNRSSKNDNRTYLVLIKSYSLLSIFALLGGYFAGVRREDAPTGLVYVPYGPARFLLPPRWVALLDALNIQIVPAVPMHLAVMMVFRALIMFNYQIKKRIVYVAHLLIFLITLPINIVFIRNYVPLEQIALDNVSTALIQEFKAGPSYAVQFDDILTRLWDLSHMLAMVSILIGFSTLLLMLWKLHSVRNVLVKDTRRLHIAFMILLTLDLIVIVIFFFIMGSVYQILSPQMADLIVMFTCPIFALCETLQGIMSLLFVPYLRAAFIRMLKGKKKRTATSEQSAVTLSVVRPR